MHRDGPIVHGNFLVAFFTWLIISAAMLQRILNVPAAYPGTLEMASLFALTYLAGMLVSFVERFSLRRRRIANGVQLLSSLALAWLLPINFLPIYTIAWLAMAVSFYSFRVCIGFAFGLATFWLWNSAVHWLKDGAFIEVALYMTFHAFALMSAIAAQRAENARDRAEALNRELITTQHLLSEASRQNERTRIARNLHDLVGHHLTALSINLQIAERTTSGEAQESIKQSRALARLLLSDVRDAVSTLRDDSEVDFRRALQLIVENVPQLNITLEIDDALRIDDIEIADALLRCIQEAITNTLRHANASTLSVRLWPEAGGVRFAVQDNGRQPPAGPEGNGVRGMRERIAEVNGELQWQPSANGVRVQGFVPLSAT